MFRGKKRAIMGIGTLIIFIATILVAAVAAGVLISTSGILQQRALITGQEARKKISNAVEVISVLAYGNKTDESLNNFEILIRLDAGSDPIQMKKFDLSFIGENHDSAGNFQASSLDNMTPQAMASSTAAGFKDAITLPMYNGTKQTIRDLDNDGYQESMYMLLTSESLPDTQFLIINFTDSDVGDFAYALADNSTSYPTTLNLTDVHVSPTDGLTYGYLDIDILLTSNMTINDTNSSIYISGNPQGKCTWTSLAPETKFCYTVVHGDFDEVLGNGEVFKVHYKMRHSNRLYIGEEFKFILSSEKGRLTSIQARTPDIIQSIRVPLWPVG